MNIIRSLLLFLVARVFLASDTRILGIDIAKVPEPSNDDRLVLLLRIYIPALNVF